MDETQFQLTRKTGADFIAPYTSAQYHIVLFSGEGSFSVDFTEYDFSGNTVLFSRLIKPSRGWAMPMQR